MILRYFLGAEAFAILGFLVGNSLFPKRYSLLFYKFFGLTVLALLTWYISLATGNTWTDSLVWAFVILIATGLALPLLLRRKVELPDAQSLKAFLGMEVLSFVIYLGLVYIRTFKPDVLGTEKLMDVALINVLLKYNHIPVANPWLSGFLMNYYYFGHFILAMLQYLLRIPSSIGYNLAISMIGVWIIQATYIVGRGLKLKEVQALILGIILTFGGNIYLFVKGFVDPKTASWFASATRVIPYTINEFPSYSVVLGDLHGHYLSYPFFLIGIFLLIDIFFGGEKPEEHAIEKGAFLGLLLGHLYLTNSWDVLTLALIGGLFAAWHIILTIKKKEKWTQARLVSFFAKVGTPLVLLSLPQFIWSRWYYLPPVGGIGLNTLFSPPWDVFLLFGQFLCIGLIACALIGAIYRHGGKAVLRSIKTPLLVCAGLVAIGALLVILVEFFYAKDVFSVLNAPYARTNTVFKMYFHVWALFAIGSVTAFLYAADVAMAFLKKLPWLYIFHLLALVVFGVMCTYPYIAVTQYLSPTIGAFTIRRITEDSYSDGYSFIGLQHSPDDELITYLQTKPFSHILEIATYDSYSYNARISAYTGNATVSGWPLHNVQWYNGYEGKGFTLTTHSKELIDISHRIEDIETMYTSTDIQKVQELLNKYEVEYVVFSSQEKTWATEKSVTLNQSIYDQLCTRDWEKGDAILFKCR